MSNADELRTLDARIATALFGWSSACPFPDGGRPLTRYASDWNAVLLLLDACVKRDWYSNSSHMTPLPDQWQVKLVFSNGPGERWIRRGQGDILPLALCRAIVGVLDALEETEKETKARES